MEFLFKLSGEHPKLPEAELKAVLEGEKRRWRVLGRDSVRRLVLFEVEGSGSFASRLALTQSVVEVVSIGRKLEEIAREVYPRMRKARSFRVRCESNTIERSLGALLHERGLNVELSNPDKTVSVFRFKDKLAAGFEMESVKNFPERHPLKRPFFHPTSMRPKLARVLVNLACVGKGQKMLDPFCGAGGILLEAGMVGLKAFGWDIDGRTLEGCGKNLRHFGVKAFLEKANALERHKILVDAVVTDPPYGKSSSTMALSPRKLYNKFVENITGNLKEDGRLVIVLPEEYKIKSRELSLEDRFSIRVHKSLTRVIWVFKKV
ncbi:MAG: THUMP domain-containing protein [Candidatus Altiarchaeota archaeon]